MYRRGILLKLLTSYGAMLIPVGILSFMAMTSGRFAESSLERIYNRLVMPESEIQEISDRSKDIAFRLTGYLAGQFPATGARNKLLENQKAIEEHWKQYTSMINMHEISPEQNALVQDIESVIRNTVAAFIEKSSKALSADNKDAISEIVDSDWPLIQMKLMKPISKLRDLQKESIKSTYDDSKAQSKAILRWGAMTIGLAIVTVALSLFMVIKITHSLVSAIKKVDELGQQVKINADHCSDGTQDLAQQIASMAGALQETSSSVEELTTIVKANTQYTKEAAEITSKNTAEAEKGEARIIRMIEMMTEMAESSKTIENALQAIDDIAFQINLLSLNAAVEAARAGESGKGFAVVAEAVRALAHKSASSAKEINLLIKENVEKTQSGRDLANDSGEVLREIVASIKSVSEINAKIADAGEKQLTGLLLISGAVAQIDNVSQNNAAISDGLVGTSGKMAGGGQDLQNLVKELLTLIEGKNTPKAS